MSDALIIAPIAALAVVDVALALLKRRAGAPPASRTSRD
jgi:hypothetical protein